MVSAYLCRRLGLLILCCIIATLGCNKSNSGSSDDLPVVQEPDKPYVLLVSFDGFRHDYATKFGATTFQEFGQNGVRAESMMPVFPTKTFPNHYSMATGMYPVNSGIIDNRFYDPASNTTYSIGDNTTILDAYYYNGTPIWNLVRENGLKSASYFWLGSEVAVGGSRPNYFQVFNSATPNETRISGVMNWFKLPVERRPDFVTLYFSLVDTQGHATGPESGDIELSVRDADQLLASLMSQVETLPFEVNVIVVSDHGMQLMENKPETFLYRDQIFEGIDMTNVRVVSNTSHLNLFVEDQATADQLYATVKQRENNFKIYRKDEIPEQWHYRDSPRVGDFFMQADAGHYFTTNPNAASGAQSVWGIHGFDPFAHPEMNGIFYAQGPAFKEGLVIPQFQSIHVYPLICEIFGITPPEDIDGRLEVLESTLKE